MIGGISSIEHVAFGWTGTGLHYYAEYNLNTHEKLRYCTVFLFVDVDFGLHELKGQLFGPSSFSELRDPLKLHPPRLKDIFDKCPWFDYQTDMFSIIKKSAFPCLEMNSMSLTRCPFSMGAPAGSPQCTE